MSDDGTPTERFDATGDVPTRKLDAAPADSPTERFEAPAAAAPAADQKSRRPVIILAVVGGLLLIALIVVLVLLLTRGGTPSALPTGTPSATPTATPTPTPTPTATPTPAPTPTETVAPPPPSTAAVVDSFTINPTSASCASGDPVITLQWSTSNANNVFFGVDTGTNDAQQSPFFADSLPASGNSTNDFPDGYRPFTYTCGNGSHTYVITAVGSDGSKDSVIVKVTG